MLKSKEPPKGTEVELHLEAAAYECFIKHFLAEYLQVINSFYILDSAKIQLFLR